MRFRRLLQGPFCCVGEFIRVNWSLFVRARQKCKKIKKITFPCAHIKHNMFVRTKKIHVVVVAQGTVNRVKKHTKNCDARAAEKGAKNVDRRPLYCRFFNELVIEAGEPCKRSLQPRIDFKSVVITLVNPSNYFLIMFEGTDRHGVGNTFKNYYKLSRSVGAHGRCYSSLSSRQPVFSTRVIQEIIHAELYG